jgi:uncharacterized 2Fe-2S/4Fe-4S cluster protein (DUF4445 family)
MKVLFHPSSFIFCKMPILKVISANETHEIECAPDQVIGEIIAASGLSLEQPCAGRGTCGKCKVIAEGALAPHDEIEQKHLLVAERTANVRLACRARVVGDARVTLMPVVVYSNKIFARSNEFRANDDPLGLAIDLGSTTVAAFLVSLKSGVVYAGAGALNQQTIFGADVIARLDAAARHADKLAALAQSSIFQAIAALKLSSRVLARIERVVIVGNTAMHHLLLRYPVDKIAVLPFQPYDRASIRDARDFFGNLFPPRARVALPPLIGGFVGSDTTACLASFDFDRARAPMLAIDLGTNGEVMATDGDAILVASTAAGPAFEGVNISSGTRAVDGAIIDARVEGGELRVTTIANRAPIGIAGSGLFALVHALRGAGVIEASGRYVQQHATIPIERSNGMARVVINERVALTQMDVRELQKAKAAIRVAADILLEKLNIAPRDVRRVILTGSFGSQLNKDALLGIGLLPNVERARIEMVANGAGLGAALFLRDEGFARGEALAARARHIELNSEPDFNARFVEALRLA